MYKQNLATPFEKQDALDLIQKERKRLTDLVKSKEFASNTRNWGWMLKWLKKSDEQHLDDKINPKADKDGGIYIDDNYACSMCGKPKRHLLVTSFSFCDEYGCGMNICKLCATEIGKKAKELPMY